MTFRLLPDWSEVWTPAEAERELTGFKFRGPGLYLDGRNTLLVQEHSDGYFTFHVYSCPFKHTVFAHRIDVREDNR